MLDKFPERIWILLSRKMAREASREEIEELNKLLSESPELRRFVDTILRLEETGDWKKGIPEEDLDEIHQQAWRKLTLQQTKRSKIRRFWSNHSLRLAAAVGAILIALTIWIWSAKSSREETEGYVGSHTTQDTLIYGSKDQQNVRLRDGTEVWLSDGSTLKVMPGFNGNERIVSLEGEAYFKVISDAANPFVVLTGDLVEIKALGTEFNIKAFPEDPTVEATLLQGKIAVNIQGEKEKQIVLRPAQKAIIHKEAPVTKSKSVEKKREVVKSAEIELTEIKRIPQTNEVVETAWRDHKLVFQNQPFRDLAYDLERKFHKKIHFEDPSVGAFHLTGTFKEENLDQILRALQVTTPFHYRIEDSLIIITP